MGEIQKKEKTPPKRLAAGRFWRGLLVFAHLGLPEELLQLGLRQQAVVLDKGGNLRGALRLVVDRPVDLHVTVESGQEFLLSLWQWREGGGKSDASVRYVLSIFL